MAGFLNKNVPALGTFEFFPILGCFDDFYAASPALRTMSQPERKNFEQIEHQA
jgi:hypothetical protein